MDCQQTVVLRAPGRDVVEAHGGTLELGDGAASLGEMVEALGHEVVVCERPAEGLDLLVAGGLDIAFVDLRMPAMNGAQFRKEAAARDPALAQRIVIMTGDIVAGPRLIAQVTGEDAVA